MKTKTLPSVTIVHAAVLLFLVVLSPHVGAAQVPVEPPAVLAQLREGNARFVSGQLQHPNQTAARREETAKGQHPVATVLTCSDSRLPVETIFDQGIGDLFVVRVAGNVARTDEIGSIEYSTGHLESRVLLVLGHTRCGAVAAVVQGAEVHGSIPELVSPIAPVVAQTRAKHPGAGVEELLAKAVENNVWASIEAVVTRSEVIRERVKSGKLQVVGGVYDLESGAVRMLGEHPEQARLLTATTEAHGPASPGEHSAAGSSAAANGAGTDHAAGPASAAPLATSVDVVALAMAGLALAALLWGAHRFSQRGMTSWTVGRRITAGFAAVLTILAGLAAVGYEAFHVSYLGFVEYRADARHSVLAGRMQANFLEMRIAVKDFQVTRAAEDIGQYDQRKGRVENFIAEAKRELSDPAQREMLAQIEAKLAEHVAGFQEMVAATKGPDGAVKVAAISQKMSAAGTAIDHAVETLKLDLIAEQDHVGPILQAKMQYTQSLLVWIGGLAVLLGVGLAIVIARSITGTLRTIVGGIDSAADQTSAAAGQVSGSSQSLAEGASEQAASLEETSSSLEEMSSMTKRNAQSAAQAKEYSNQTRSAADLGSADMNEMKEAMAAIKTSSDGISKILKTIDEIAFQTNILALNAAVEAARAGEAGMGFAVVAEEVRNLAQRSAESARETAAKIDDSVRRSENGVRICGKVAQSLDQIVEKARQVDALIAEIAAATQEQSQGIGQLNTAVGMIDQVTQANAGAAEETAAAAEELSAQAMTLQQSARELRRLIDRAGAATTAPAERPAAATARRAEATRPQPSLKRPQLDRGAATRGSHTLTFVEAGSAAARTGGV